MKARPIDYLRRIYYDCITYDLGALRYLISVVGADRVMFGTDWPHQVHDIAGSLANTAALPEASARRSAAGRRPVVRALAAAAQRAGRRAKRRRRAGRGRRRRGRRGRARRRAPTRR